MEFSHSLNRVADFFQVAMGAIDKHVVENRGLLSKAKYLRKKIKAGTAEDWMVVSFEANLPMRSNEHKGGRRKKK